MGIIAVNVAKGPRRKMKELQDNRKPLEQVENFKYLGVHLNEIRLIDS